MEQNNQEPVIVVEQLVAGYGESVILDDVSFRVAPGELLAIVGGSGCGKSTLLKYMIGLRRTRRGRVMIHGVDIMSADEVALNRQRLEIGVLFQSDALIGSMTLAENVALPLQEHTDLDAPLISLLVKTKLAMVQLAGYENHYPSELSGGMKKRAGLARAMALDPTILFFDEPSTGLDPITAGELYALIKNMNRIMRDTMIIITHDLDLVFTVADRVIMLDREKKGIIAEGAPMALRQGGHDHRVHDFFNRKQAVVPAGYQG